MEDKIYPICRRCGRKLKTEEAQRLGYGKVCFKKVNENSMKPLIGEKVCKE